MDKPKENPDETTDVSTKTTEAEASAAVTQAVAKCEAVPAKPLKVQPSTEFGAVTTDVLKQAQVQDPTLKSCWESVGTGLEQSKLSGWQRQMLLNDGLFIELCQDRCQVVQMCVRLSYLRRTGPASCD